MDPLTSEQFFDVFAGMRRGELVHDIQSRLVISVPDVHINPSLYNIIYKIIQQPEMCNCVLIGNMTFFLIFIHFRLSQSEFINFIVHFLLTSNSSLTTSVLP